MKETDKQRAFKKMFDLREEILNKGMYERDFVLFVPQRIDDWDLEWTRVIDYSPIFKKEGKQIFGKSRQYKDYKLINVSGFYYYCFERDVAEPEIQWDIKVARVPITPETLDFARFYLEKYKYFESLELNEEFSEELVCYLYEQYKS